MDMMTVGILWIENMESAFPSFMLEVLSRSVSAFVLNQ